MEFAIEPNIHATLLQRTAVTARMNRGEDHRTAHKEVGKSKGINLALLFGIPEDDHDQLADLSFNKTKGIKLFGREQKLLQIEMQEEVAAVATTTTTTTTTKAVEKDQDYHR